jgi:UDPglucose--hexose-1-phosphate uridylyltransferase
MPFTPKLVREEVDAFKRYRRNRGVCPFCNAWKSEMKTSRKIMEDDYIAVFAPYASRVPMEAWIMPKRHVMKLSELKKEEYESLAKALKHVLGKLKELGNAPYNYYVHSAPYKEDFHLHIEVLPKLAIWAGFELGSEVYINTLPPESAAEYYQRQ